MSGEVCPACECPFEQSVTSVFGGSIDHDEAKQARTCFEPLEEVNNKNQGQSQEVAAVRLFYHSAEQVMDSDTGRTDEERVDLSDTSG
jgi:hypothetical protein